MREIVQMLVQREYINANDAYLRMAIGNAAWPIGVTNVGIHSRTGREKIFSQNIAHVLNDETQRKYIQVRARAKSAAMSSSATFSMAATSLLAPLPPPYTAAL